ncbi:MAG: type II secretion system GspH family protein, partial [Nitrospirae bacterium]|nr:type II secretion system GspH family protein [Nitrospirota bacterium]
MRNAKLKKGFSLTEVIITISLFILLAGGGVGAYFNYYMVSLYNADVDNAMTLIKNTRFKAL